MSGLGEGQQGWGVVSDAMWLEVISETGGQGLRGLEDLVGSSDSILHDMIKGHLWRILGSGCNMIAWTGF